MQLPRTNARAGGTVVKHVAVGTIQAFEGGNYIKTMDAKWTKIVQDETKCRNFHHKNVLICEGCAARLVESLAVNV